MKHRHVWSLLRAAALHQGKLPPVRSSAQWVKDLKKSFSISGRSFCTFPLFCCSMAYSGNRKRTPKRESRTSRVGARRLSNESHLRLFPFTVLHSVWSLKGPQITTGACGEGSPRAPPTRHSQLPQDVAGNSSGPICLWHQKVKVYRSEIWHNWSQAKLPEFHVHKRWSTRETLVLYVVLRWCPYQPSMGDRNSSWRAAWKFNAINFRATLCPLTGVSCVINLYKQWSFSCLSGTWKLMSFDKNHSVKNWCMLPSEQGRLCPWVVDLERRRSQTQKRLKARSRSKKRKWIENGRSGNHAHSDCAVCLPQTALLQFSRHVFTTHIIISVNFSCSDSLLVEKPKSPSKAFVSSRNHWEPRARATHRSPGPYGESPRQLVQWIHVLLWIILQNSGQARFKYKSMQCVQCGIGQIASAWKLSQTYDCYSSGPLISLDKWQTSKKSPPCKSDAFSTQMYNIPLQTQACEVFMDVGTWQMTWVSVEVEPARMAFGECFIIKIDPPKKMG